MKTKNISVPREYKGRDGQTRTQWVTIGKLFIKDDGKMSGRLNCIPTTWEGNFFIFDDDKAKEDATKKTDTDNDDIFDLPY